MRNTETTAPGTAPAGIRCAIYTRKSTEEGLDQEFNSLDAQREAGEAYVASQRHEGWQCSPDRYDDGGFSGANAERPALRRLLADIERGKIDVVVVYKVDRLSRSLLDFAKMMETFDRHQVSFVSVTQQFNTATSMGRLILNVLLSFAQFEREMIAERTRDKIAAARKKGRWIGGAPPLGYEVDSGKLVIHAVEAEQVREMCRLYLRERSLIATANELNRRGWRTKRWTTRKGRCRGGAQWDKGSVHRVLTNVVYIGKVTYKGEIYEGLHEPILDEETFRRVRECLDAGRVEGTSILRNRHQFLLRGLLRCGACGTGMSSSWTRRRDKVYRYYVCDAVNGNGRAACPVRSIAADAIESFIIERVREIATTPEVIEQALLHAAEEHGARLAALAKEDQRLEVQQRHCREEARGVLAVLAKQGEHPGQVGPERLGELERQAAQIQERRREIHEEMAALEGASVGAGEVRDALSLFVPIWEVLGAAEKARIVRLLLSGVEYNGQTGQVALSFYPLGIQHLAREARAAGAAAAEVRA